MTSHAAHLPNVTSALPFLAGLFVFARPPRYAGDKKKEGIRHDCKADFIPHPHRADHAAHV
ncbi:hypothetical protein AGATL06_22230 [Agathobaculum sp. TL06]